LIKSVSSCSIDPLLKPLPDPLLDRFCSQILPETRNQVNWLNLEATSMDRILLCTNYPNLYGLGLYGIGPDKARDLFIGKVFYFVLIENK
jgi:hypothetical protein